MATITVTSNPSTTGDTLTVNFTTDVTNISDILLSKDGGSTYISATSFTKTSAVFNISNWVNGTYDKCKLKCVYTESGGGTTDTYYTITYTLNQATSSNSTKSIKKGSSYSTIVAANEGYNVKNISVVMGGTDISNTVIRGSNINIPNVTGNITITVTTEAIVTPDTYYTIRYSLHDSTSSNTITSIKEGSSYSTTITANNGYKVNTISCMMGGSDVSNSVVSGNKINIPNVTGDVSVLVDTEAIATPETLTISNIGNITQTEKTEFYIEYSTNIAVVKHEVSWDGGHTFYDKTTDVESSGTRYRFKHDNKANAGTYQMAIRVTTAKGTTKTSNVFTVTLATKDGLTFTQYKRLNDGVITDTTDGTYYSTLNYISVVAGKSYTINLNKANYVCVCYYNSSNSYVSYAEGNTDDWSNKALSYTFTVPANITKILICATGDSSTAITGTLKENGSSSLLDSTGAYVIDDFSGSSVDSNKWGYELGYVRNNETQRYTNTNAEINDGILALRGKKASDGSWTSASIISKGHFAFMYGKIVARVRPCNWNGSFGAFWTLGDSFEFGYKENGSPDTLGEWWAYCGEFDVMEFYNGKLTCGTFFNEKEESGRVWYDNYPTGDWHEFAMEWNTDGSLVFSIDGNELSRTSATDNRAFHIPHFILLNQAIGASGGTPDSNTTEITQYVDWVKYYPLSTDNLVENSSDFELEATDFNDSSHNCVVRPKFNDNCINKSITWQSNNTSLVTCHSGLCSSYAGANGEVIITGTSHSGVSKQITLTVSNGVLKAKDNSSGGGTTPTTYTITNNLTNCTTSNTLKSIKAGRLYETTITPNSGYNISSIKVTMGGTDITSSVLSGDTITINKVTGNVVITAKAIEQVTPPEPGTIGNMTFGKKVDNSTHKIVNSTDDWATVNPVTVEKGAHYSLQMDATWVWCYAYDDNDNFVKELFTTTGDYNTKYTFVAETTKIRYGCYDPRKYLSYCNLTKTS